MANLAILIDPNKGLATERVFNAVVELSQTPLGKEFLEIYVGCSEDFGKGVKTYVKRFNDLNISIPIKIFPGNPFQVSEYANFLLVPAILNYTKKKIKIALVLGKIYIQLKRITTVLKRKPFPVRQAFGYFVLGPETRVGRKLGARAISDDEEAMKIIERYVKKKNPWGVYIEAGSGANHSVATRPELIKQASLFLNNISTLVVGGGIKTEQEIETLLELGAQVVVVSTVLEQSENPKGNIIQFLDVFKKNKERK